MAKRPIAKEVQAEGVRFLVQFDAANEAERLALRQSGQDLARRVHGAAIDLCYDKATELSPIIPQLFLLAAKIAYLAHGPDTPELARFEKEVDYYANFAPPDPIVADYEAFKRVYRLR